jgi:hypothetical protein
MTYTIKEKDGKLSLYNTSTKKMLSKKYTTPQEAKAAVQRLNKTNKGVRKYHSCCRSHGCGKKGKRKKSTRTKKLPSTLPTIQAKPKKKKKKRVALTQVSTRISAKAPLRKLTKGQQRYKDTVMGLTSKAKNMDSTYKNILF